jgi:hypothetical protein
MECVEHFFDRGTDFIEDAGARCCAPEQRVRTVDVKADHEEMHAAKAEADNTERTA